MSGGANYGAAVNDVGSAVGDLFTAAGAREAASMYGQAATEAQSNVQIEQGNIITQTAQATRQYMLTAGAQSTEISAAGFSGTSSTAQALEFASKSQFGINLQNMTNQDVIQENAYKSQEAADKSMQAQEETKAEGADVGAVFSGVAAVASLL